MTDFEEKAASLSRELDAAFRNRADLYRLFYDELCAAFDAETAKR